MLTIINERSSLTIVNEGLSLSIVNETTNFIRMVVFEKKITGNFIECRLTYMKFNSCGGVKTVRDIRNYIAVP